eukprot:gene13160-9006_t
MAYLASIGPHCNTPKHKRNHAPNVKRIQAYNQPCKVLNQLSNPNYITATYSSVKIMKPTHPTRSNAAKPYSHCTNLHASPWQYNNTQLPQSRTCSNKLNEEIQRAHKPISINNLIVNITPLNPQVTPQTLHYGNSLSNYNHLSTKLDHSYPASRPANPKSRSITIYQEHHLSQNHTPGAQATHPQPPITTQNPAAVSSKSYLVVKSSRLIAQIPHVHCATLAVKPSIGIPPKMQSQINKVQLYNKLNKIFTHKPLGGVNTNPQSNVCKEPHRHYQMHIKRSNCKAKPHVPKPQTSTTNINTRVTRMCHIQPSCASYKSTKHAIVTSLHPTHAKESPTLNNKPNPLRLVELYALFKTAHLNTGSTQGSKQLKLQQSQHLHKPHVFHKTCHQHHPCKVSSSAGKCNYVRQATRKNTMPQFERANNLTPPIKDYNEQSNTKSKKPTLKLKNPSANINNQQSHGTLPTTLNNTTYHNHCQATVTVSHQFNTRTLYETFGKVHQQAAHHTRHHKLNYTKH